MAAAAGEWRGPTRELGSPLPPWRWHGPSLAPPPGLPMLPTHGRTTLLLGPQLQPVPRPLSPVILSHAPRQPVPPPPHLSPSCHVGPYHSAARASRQRQVQVGPVGDMACGHGHYQVCLGGLRAYRSGCLGSAGCLPVSRQPPPTTSNCLQPPPTAFPPPQLPEGSGRPPCQFAQPQGLG